MTAGSQTFEPWIALTTILPSHTLFISVMLYVINHLVATAAALCRNNNIIIHADNIVWWHGYCYHFVTMHVVCVCVCVRGCVC